MQLIVDAKGQVRCLYSEVIDLAAFGPLDIRRASQVEPDADGRWWADLAPVGGPKLGPFDRRSQALDAERTWLEDNRLNSGGANVKPKFDLGKIVGTPGAIAALQESGQEPTFFLQKHVSGDWGGLSAGDKQLNDQALQNGSRIFSAYRTLRNEELWVITEADRSQTTILLPEEY